MGGASAEQEVKRARDERNGEIIRASKHEGALGPGRWVEEREAPERSDALTLPATPEK